MAELLSPPPDLAHGESTLANKVSSAVQGTVFWVYISEVFPNSVHGKGQTLGSFTRWFLAMLVSWTFPLVAKDAGQPNAGLPLAFFAVIMMAQVVLVGMLCPETKRVALEEMQQRPKG
jgi:hypothetical protein